MAIKHQIRDKRQRKTRTVNLTPLSAIRAFCFECTGYNYYEVEKCTAPLCHLFPFRNPNATKGTRNVSKKGIEAIQKLKRERGESKQKDSEGKHSVYQNNAILQPIGLYFSILVVL